MGLVQEVGAAYLGDLVVRMRRVECAGSHTFAEGDGRG